MTNYRFICNDRNYADIKIYEDSSMDEVEIELSCNKLFNHDVFSLAFYFFHLFILSSLIFSLMTRFA